MAARWAQPIAPAPTASEPTRTHGHIGAEPPPERLPPPVAAAGWDGPVPLPATVGGGTAAADGSGVRGGGTTADGGAGFDAGGGASRSTPVPPVAVAVDVFVVPLPGDAR